MGNTLTLMNSTLGDSFDVETMRLTLEAMFNGTFFYGQQKEDGTADKDSGGILVKINTKTGEPSCYSLNRSTASLLCSAMP